MYTITIEVHTNMFVLIILTLYDPMSPNYFGLVAWARLHKRLRVHLRVPVSYVCCIT